MQRISGSNGEPAAFVLLLGSDLRGMFQVGSCGADLTEKSGSDAAVCMGVLKQCEASCASCYTKSRLVACR